MGGSSAHLVHQLPRADGFISGPETRSPVAERPSCHSVDVHYNSSLLYKLPGGSTFTPPIQNNATDLPLGPGQVTVTHGSLNSWAPECGSGFNVQTENTDWGMETPPQGSQTDMA